MPTTCPSPSLVRGWRMLTHASPAPTRPVPPPPRYVPGILPRTGARIPPRPGTQPPTTPPKLPQVLQAESVCVRSQSFNASFMRVCHPAPVARKAFSTSGLYLIATCSFTGRRFGPRVLTLPTTTPPRFITAPSQSETVVRGLSGSIGVVVPVDALSMLSCLVNVGDRVQTVGTVLLDCATVSPGARNTLIEPEGQAPTLSGASSRPDFGGHGATHFRAAFGRGALVRKAAAWLVPCFHTPSTRCIGKMQRVGFSLNQEQST